jgi:hypothetical protein
MNTRTPHQHGADSKLRTRDCVAVRGVDQAIRFARFGRLISAIKYIESANPQISRETAKAIVRSFGYDCESRWPEIEDQSERNRVPVRCL